MYRKIEELAVQAGDIILSASNIEDKTREKTSQADIVTEFDLRVQSFLFRELSALFPDAFFFGEEEEHCENITEKLSGRVFIIDPIDGTTNFVRGRRECAVSIALIEKREPVYSCIYNPYSEELFTAFRRSGAFLNGKRITTPKRDIKHSIVAFGTSPYNKELCEATFDIAKHFVYEAMDVRRCGSAVLDIVDTALGRADLYFEMRVSPWDFAAGYLFAKEAGCVVSRMNGKPMSFAERSSILVSTVDKAEYFISLELVRKYADIL